MISIDTRKLSRAAFFVAVAMMSFGGMSFRSLHSAEAREIDGLELQQNYPNPFVNSTEIRYTIPVPGNVLIRVFNTLGKDVDVLVNENKTTGTYSTRFEAASFPSGQYTYTLVFTSDDGTKAKLTRKMYLVR